MKAPAIVAFSLITTGASAHPGHGKGWYHEHAGDLVDAAFIAVACVVAAAVLGLLWKAVSR